MTNEEGLFWLNDRIEKIRDIQNEYDLLNHAYLSFSGGKDSTVLHYLLDMAISGNQIPRVYINTGMEYNDIRLFVKKMASEDFRIKVINSGINIPKMLSEYGYPFKSKEHSLKISQYKRGSSCSSVLQYRNGYGDSWSRYQCPKRLLYQFEDGFTLKISNKCCYKLKKEPMHQFEKDSGRKITLTGMRNAEGGQRASMGCIIIRGNNFTKFHPLMPLTDDFMDWFIQYFNIKLCRLYYPPFNFNRTGCKGCPFTLDLQAQLDIMARYLPNEKKQCEFLWKPVYDEYRRIGYRLRRFDCGKQLNLYDFL